MLTLLASFQQASLEDYARVPVGAFGLAMLRGMGWKPGQAASRSGRGAIEAHVPSSRPSLLGIGAKPMAEAMGDDKKGTKGKNGSSAPAGKSRREEMKFMPLVKQAREGSASGRSVSILFSFSPLFSFELLTFLSPLSDTPTYHRWFDFVFSTTFPLSPSIIFFPPSRTRPLTSTRKRTRGKKKLKIRRRRQEEEITLRRRTKELTI